MKIQKDTSLIPEEARKGKRFLVKNISLIIPAFNEADVLEDTLESLYAWTPSPGTSLLEIIVIDDGSSDTTGALLETAVGHYDRLVILRNNDNRGKGYSVRRGVLESKGDIIGFTDADLAYDPSQYNAFIDYLLDNPVDMCAGSRHLIANSGLDNYSTRRLFSSHIFQFIIRCLGLTSVTDSQCGIKFFTSAVRDRIFPFIRQTGFTFDVEMLYRCRQLGLSVAEIPVIMQKQSHSTIRLRKQAPRMLLDLIRIRLASFSNDSRDDLPSKSKSLQ